MHLKIIILGTGTSQGIPIALCNCPTCQSKDPRDKRLRCSAIFQIENTSILIDTGPDFRRQMLNNKVTNISAIIYTHEHNDHVVGLDDIRPFNFKQKEAMNIFGLPRVINDLKSKFHYIFEKNPYPGAPMVNIKYLDDSPVMIEDIAVVPIPILHGKLEILGYRIANAAYITDVSAIPSSSYDLLKDLDVLIISALRREAHYSHFTLDDALKAIEITKPKRAYLTHLCNHFEIHQKLESTLPSGVFLAYDGMVLYSKL